MRMLVSTALVAAGLSLSGCGGTNNRGLESVHQPVIQRTDYVFDASAGSGGLGTEETRRLSGWLDSIRFGYGDRISVDGAYGYEAARDDIATLAARYGLLLSPTPPVTAGSVPPGAVRVVVSRARAAVPDCPDWSRASHPNLGQHTGSNFGCAINTNLAAMAANPEDLVYGRDDGWVDPEVSAKAIKTYRTTPPTGTKGLKIESSAGGNE